ncbi:MAG: hypothetical protein R2744_10155 [Bacteroidales bacterium]
MKKISIDQKKSILILTSGSALGLVLIVSNYIKGRGIKSQRGGKKRGGNSRDAVARHRRNLPFERIYGGTSKAERITGLADEVLGILVGDSFPGRCHDSTLRTEHSPKITSRRRLILPAGRSLLGLGSCQSWMYKRIRTERTGNLPSGELSPCLQYSEEPMDLHTFSGKTGFRIR